MEIRFPFAFGLFGAGEIDAIWRQLQESSFKMIATRVEEFSLKY